MSADNSVLNAASFVNHTRVAAAADNSVPNAAFPHSLSFYFSRSFSLFPLFFLFSFFVVSFIKSTASILLCRTFNNKMFILKEFVRISVIAPCVSYPREPVYSYNVGCTVIGKSSESCQETQHVDKTTMLEARPVR